MPEPLLVPFELVAGHVVARLGDLRVLVDTGSPLSFGRCETMALLSGEKPISRHSLGFTVEQVVDHIRQLPGASPDVDLDAVLGTDLLWGHRLLIDFPSSVLRIDLATPPDGAPRKRFLVEDLLVWGAPVPAVVDTGAPISYLSATWSSGFRPAGRARDFFHGEGAYEVPLRRGRAVFRGREVVVDFAEPPAAVSMSMRLLGVDAIVGTDLLAQLGVAVVEIA